MIRYFFLVIFITILSKGYGQEPFIKRGLMRAQATISPGKMVNVPRVSSFYIHADLEYYFDERFSVRGDTYYHLGENTAFHPFYDFNHSAFAGLSYHFTGNKKFDPYVSFEPGAGYSRVQISVDHMNSNYQDNVKARTSINPLVSCHLGMNLYARKYFHLLAGVRYVYGTHMDDFSTFNLNELRFSFGLGWNLRIKKYEEKIKTDEGFKG